ncbi:unnamed protein product [Paramecium sonneborni]|uniref:Uncharacterized protein n=1 Tax=Paramecium sonneborni TaxID=65129 RepID=A0A8S1PB59_9CILI|nr:unnamed protein product [Paramecium sonneborni]
MFSRKVTQQFQQNDQNEKDKRIAKMQTSFFKSFTSSKREGKDGDEFQFFFRSQDCAFHTILFMMVNFQKAEEESKKKGFSLLSNPKPIMNMESYSDISELRPELIYFFTVISVRDLHDFYVDFYASFDTNRNFSLEKKELQKMLEIVLGLIGHQKFKVFSDQALIDNEAFDGTLNQKILNDIGENFMLPNEQNKVDYLLIFPYILSFYLEYTYQDIRNKQKRLDIIKGTEYLRGKEVEIKNITSLISILKEMGIDYLKDKNTYKISFRDVENILLKFKNIQKWMTFEVIQQILQSLSKLMFVDEKTQEETKKLKLHKIIDFVALKLCIHQDCLKIKKQKKESNQSVFLEILVLWNCAQLSRFSEKKTLTLKFEKFLDKHFYEKETFNRLEMQKCLEKFFKKFYQLMPKKQIYDIIQCHQLFTDKNIIKNYSIEREEFKNSLFTMICKDGYNKLKQYVKIIFDGITKQSKTTTIQYQNYGKELDQESIQGGLSSQKQTRDRQISQQTNSYQQQQYQKQQKEKEKEKEVSDSDSSSNDEKQKGVQPSQKFKTAVRTIQSGNMIMKERNESKDILKACLMMDSFLKRQTQRLQNYVKVSKSVNISVVKSDVKQQDKSLFLDQDEQKELFDPSDMLNKKRQEQKNKEIYNIKKTKEGKVWEKNDVPQDKKIEQDMDVVSTQVEQPIEIPNELRFPEGKQKKKLNRLELANELQMVLGKSNSDFGSNNFKQAIRLQSASQMTQPIKISKQQDEQDNLVIINETVLDNLIRRNQHQERVRKSTRDDCQCLIY